MFCDFCVSCNFPSYNISCFTRPITWLNIIMLEVLTIFCMLHFQINNELLNYGASPFLVHNVHMYVFSYTCIFIIFLVYDWVLGQ